MATQYNASTWTGTYSGNSRNFCGYVIYNWYPNYSATQSLFQIIEIGVRQTSGGSTEWSGGTAIATVSGTGQTSKSASRALSSNKLSWSGAGNKALNSSTTNWYWPRTTSAQTKTITVYGAKSGGSAWSGSKSSSFTLTVPALSSYAVTYYANGGTGAPSSQTKFYNVPLNLSTAIPTRTGYTFKGWNTNASGSGTSYASGSTYTGNSALGLYAVWSANTCTVSYNANGGTGSISAQTKVYDQTLTLSNGAGFTRTNHSITGWNTSADGTGTPYTLSEVLGTTFLTPLTLYAQWHLDYIAPIISNFDAYRVASASSSTETDDGEYIYISFDYQAGTADSGTTWETPTCVIEIDGTTVYNNTLTIDGNGQGSFPASTVAYGTYSKDTTHTVEVTIHDTYGVDVTATADINTATYPIDLVGSGIDVYMGVMTPAVNGQQLTLPVESYIDGKRIGSGGVVGAVQMFAGSTSPTGWLLCDGSAVSRVTYADLFTVIGTTYGAGDGITTFNLPNLEGKVAVGVSTTYTLGSTGGEETHTLTENEMPSHTHIQNSHNHSQNAHAHSIKEQASSVAKGTAYARPRTESFSGSYGYVTSSTTATNIAATATNQNTGGGLAHNNMQPYVAMNYIIYAGA